MHLAQGVLGGVNGDIVVIQHGVAAAEVDGIKVVLALGSGELCLGTACREGTAQLDAHLLHLGALGFLDGDGVPAAGVGTQQLHLHQLDVGVLARADAGEGSGGTVFSVAPHHLHHGQAAARLGVHGKDAQGVGVGSVQRDLKEGGRFHLGIFGHRQRMADGGIFQQIGIDGLAHAALRKGGEVVLGFADPGGQGEGDVRFAPVVAGDLRQRRCFGSAVDAALVPSRNRQTIHVQVIHNTSGPPFSRCCPSFRGG